MSKQIAIVSGIQPYCNPRVIKEARVLSDAGWNIEIIYPQLNAAWIPQDTELASQNGWKLTPTVTAGSNGKIGLKHRLRKKVAGWLASGGLVTGDHLGYGLQVGLNYLQHKSWDLVIGHLEEGLWTCLQLPEGQPYALDLEDWYSRDLPNTDRHDRIRRYLAELERRGIQDARYVTTTSQVMAKAMAETYHADTPQVIYNAFPPEKPSCTPARENSLIQLVWLSQTIGPNRGLEEIISALNQTSSPCCLNLIGEGDASYLATLHQNTSPQIEIKQHARVPVADIPQTLNRFDIGLALELPYCDNKRLTASNKIFHYLEAGIPVIATDTPGQKEVFDQVSEAGWLLSAHKPETWASTLSNNSLSPERITEIKERLTRETLPRTLTWAEQARRLQELVQQATR